jgi:trehalose 6-phosphate synthase
MRRDILLGLLGADVLGFQTAQAAENFLRLTQDLLGVPPYDHPFSVDSAPQVGVFPTAVDTSNIADLARRTGIADQAALLRKDLGDPRLVVLSIDAADESYGMERRLRAIGELFGSGRLVPQDVAFVQIVAGLNEVGATELHDRIGREVARINGQFASVGRPCVHYEVASPTLADRVALYRAADIMLATPLREGSSLSALEYVAARDGDGALVLSEFSGTASALAEAYLINPYDDDQIKDGILGAIAAPPGQRLGRMSVMREYVRGYDNTAWARSFLLALRSPDDRPRDATTRPSDWPRATIADRRRRPPGQRPWRGTDSNR